ncbi:MAG: hypothetical protein WCJ18_10715, partial [Planctomycetota bacterium]
AKDRVVWAPENFRGAAEAHRFVMPGAIVRGYPAGNGRPDPGAVGGDDLVILVRGLGEDPPPGAIGSRLELKSRQTPAEVLAMLRGRVQENLFCREWLVK